MKNRTTDENNMAETLLALIIGIGIDFLSVNFERGWRVYMIELLYTPNNIHWTRTNALESNHVVWCGSVSWLWDLGHIRRGKQLCFWSFILLRLPSKWLHRQKICGVNWKGLEICNSPKIQLKNHSNSKISKPGLIFGRTARESPIFHHRFLTDAQCFFYFFSVNVEKALRDYLRSSSVIHQTIFSGREQMWRGSMSWLWDHGHIRRGKQFCLLDFHSSSFAFSEVGKGCKLLSSPDMDRRKIQKKCEVTCFSTLLLFLAWSVTSLERRTGRADDGARWSWSLQFYL